MRASRGGAAVKGLFVPGHAPRPAVARRRPGREGRRRRARAGPRASVVAARQGQGTRRGPPHGTRAPWGACAHSAWLSLRACLFPPSFRVFRGAHHRGLRVPSGRSRFSWWQDTSGCSSPYHLGVSGCPPGHLGGRGMTHGIRAPEGGPSLGHGDPAVYPSPWHQGVTGRPSPRHQGTLGAHHCAVRAPWGVWGQLPHGTREASEGPIPMASGCLGEEDGAHPCGTGAPHGAHGVRVPWDRGPCPVGLTASRGTHQHSFRAPRGACPHSAWVSPGSLWAHPRGVWVSLGAHPHGTGVSLGAHPCGTWAQPRVQPRSPRPLCQCHLLAKAAALARRRTCQAAHTRMHTHCPQHTGHTRCQLCRFICPLRCREVAAALLSCCSLWSGREKWLRGVRRTGALVTQHLGIPTPQCPSTLIPGHPDTPAPQHPGTATSQHPSALAP